ncbi:MAG: PhoH family protein [Bacillales bacterium]|jgi:phosphate starvation-inducible PhoH-like protein|nr:PhoH family protein [Bacillales bacterium]
MTDELKIIEQQLESNEEAIALFGVRDNYLKIIEQMLNVNIVSRGEQISITGNSENLAIVEKLFDTLLTLIRKGHELQERDILYITQLHINKKPFDIEDLFDTAIMKNTRGKTIRAKTFGQREYINAIRKNDLVLGIGPAGTGKTYLAVVMAVNALKNNQVKKIVLTRPAVEAGESLGFLPGDLKEKVDPYLRPLYDALHDVLGQEHTLRMMEKGIIEVAPLAYMRGRTLEDAFVILDEAQNTTISQMKMFLTRLGFNSKMVVNGDRSQVDLPKGVRSGLETAIEVLNDVKGCSLIFLDHTDVVRHPLVQRIIVAFEKAKL